MEPPMSNSAGHVEAVRRFNRFYTRQIGVLTDALLESPFSLSEARAIYELANREQSTATELRSELDLDAGYLSRMLRSLRKRGLVQRQASAADGRQVILRLTEAGQAAFATLNSRSRHQIDGMLSQLDEGQQRELVDAMQAIERLLGAASEQRAPYILRPHQPGDIGWVIQRHGLLYNQEYGWDETFEALVARVAADFLDNYDQRRERCWIAERHGEMVGSVFVTRLSDEVAKLRLLLVEPKARGLGIGARLVDECVRFARQAGYRTMTLWTNENLIAARRIYARAGFKLAKVEPHHSFGHDLVGETWEIEL
jgi:DNA-binding MarR family transcriptional regulator/N-acetylglutamate synthase-like GNAT family acetyltransferase